MVLRQIRNCPVEKFLYLYHDAKMGFAISNMSQILDVGQMDKRLFLYADPIFKPLLQIPFLHHDTYIKTFQQDNYEFGIGPFHYYNGASL